jgi:hypothetical protein
MAPTPPDSETSPGADARARQGLEHLQAAARELIGAARAVLDVAEEVLDDPDALAGLAGMAATLGEVGRRVTGAGTRPAPGGGADARRGPGAEPRVQRITVT